MTTSIITDYFLSNHIKKSEWEKLLVFLPLFHIKTTPFFNEMSVIVYHVLTSNSNNTQCHEKKKISKSIPKFVKTESYFFISIDAPDHSRVLLIISNHLID